MLSAGPPTTYRRGGGVEVSAKKRGPGPSHLLLTPDDAGNVVGIDPHKQTLTATVVDARGGIVACEHFKVSGGGRRALGCGAREVWRTPLAGGVTRRSSLSTGAMTCATCAPTARRAGTGRGSAASQTRWMPSGSRAR